MNYYLHSISREIRNNILFTFNLINLIIINVFLHIFICFGIFLYFMQYFKLKINTKSSCIVKYLIINRE
jgi:magnesium-transporting ATPase (P-type)